MSFLTAVLYNRQLNGTQLKDAREWLIECYPDDEDVIDQACNEDIERSIEKYFDGGIEAFIKSGEPV